MPEEALITLIKSAPSAAAILVAVWMFLRQNTIDSKARREEHSINQAKWQGLIELTNENGRKERAEAEKRWVERMYELNRMHEGQIRDLVGVAKNTSDAVAGLCSIVIEQGVLITDHTGKLDRVLAGDQIPNGRTR